MKKLKSSFKNMTVVLTLVAVVTGALLAYVNNVTAKPIKDIQVKQLNDGIKNVIGVPDLTVKKNFDTVIRTYEGKQYTFVIYHTVDKAQKPLGVAVESTTNGFGGPLRVLVGFDNAGVIKGYTILESTETPGLGVRAATWFQKGGKGNIIGRNPSKPLAVSKDGGDVDAITASTITSRAFLKAINQAYMAVHQQ